jgi:hypothetical protein
LRIFDSWAHANEFSGALYKLSGQVLNRVIKRQENVSCGAVPGIWELAVLVERLKPFKVNTGKS